MVSYILRRVLSTVPVMAIVALFVFSLLYIAPGDPAAIIAGDQASPADVERIRQGLGLDRPFLVQFGSWLWRILHGDLGTSIFTNLPVAHMIAQLRIYFGLLHDIFGGQCVQGDVAARSRKAHIVRVDAHSAGR